MGLGFFCDGLYGKIGQKDLLVLKLGSLSRRELKSMFKEGYEATLPVRLLHVIPNAVTDFINENLDFLSLFVGFILDGLEFSDVVWKSGCIVLK